MRYLNIPALFSERVTQYRGQNVFFVRREGQWVGMTWDQFDKEAHEFGWALIAKGLRRGTAVSILMGQVPEWPVSDIGTIIAGGVSVGLYPTSSAEQCQFIINHSDSEFVLVDTQAQLDKIQQIRGGIPKIRDVIVLDEIAARGVEDVISYREFLLFGRQNQKTAHPILQERAERAGADDVAIMVYTSGTTGLPKGACLSHRYVINSVESLLETIPVYDSDVSFSYLPYCHVAERIAGFYNRLYAGAPAYFVDDLSRLWDYMLEVKPTVFGSVPRFYEKIHARIISDIEQRSAEQREAFYRAIEIGRKITRLRQARRHVPDELKREYEREAQPAVTIVKECFGGDIRITTSGGAPLPLEIAEFFDAAGIPILQAYGLTENICVAFNRPDNYRFGTVGPPMPGCEVKIAADGEIMVRGQMMFSGYHRDPEKTAEAFRDGWLLTGDLGELDSDGFLRITGRKKELIITSTGKNISPMLIENRLKNHPLISQVMVYGDGKSFLVALITLNEMEVESYARARSLSYDHFAELTRHREIVSLIRKAVDDVNARLSSTESIKKFVILDHDLSIEAGEITPTMKIRRNVVSDRYRELLEGLYD